jgi:hypothetical protein
MIIDGCHVSLKIMSFALLHNFLGPNPMEGDIAIWCHLGTIVDFVVVLIPLAISTMFLLKGDGISS